MNALPVFLTKNILNWIAKFCVVTLFGLFSLTAHAITLTLAATSTTGNYTLSWSGASYEGPSYQNHSRVKIEEKIGTSYTTLAYGNYTGITGSFSVTNKLSGTYTYRVTDCPSFSCFLSDQKSITVTLPKPVITTSFSANPISEGGSSTLNWSAANATSCSSTAIFISGISGSVVYNASSVMSANQTVNFPITCTGTGGSTTTTPSLTVNWVNDLPVISSLSSVSTAANTSFLVQFSISDEETATASLGVTATSSDQSKIANGSIVVDRANNRLSVSPVFNASGAVSITITVTDANGGVKSVSVPVTIAPVPIPTVSASLSPSSINESGSATLTWSSTNATSCSATGISGVSATSGSVTYSAPTVMSANQTVTIPVTCSGVSGSTTANASITVNWVNDLPTITAQGSLSTPANTAFLIPFNANDEETAVGSLGLTAVSSDQSKVANGSIVVDRANNRLSISPVFNASGPVTITLTVTDGSGAVASVATAVTIAPVPAPTVTASLSPNPISESGSATLTWSSTNATSCSATGISGVSATSGSVTYLAPTVMSVSQTVTIPVTCTGVSGTATTNASVLVNWVNDLPTLSTTSSASAGANTPFTISYTVSDEETAAASLVVTGSSNDQAKIPNSNIVVNSATNLVTITPIASGSAVVTLRVTDGSGGFVEVPVNVTIAPQLAATQLISTAIIGSSIKVDWLTVAGASTYELQRNGATINNANVLTFNDSNVAVNNTYTYQVRACSSNNCSPWMSATSYFAKNDFYYDELGRVITSSDPINGARNFNYDPAGNRTTVVVGNNRLPIAVNDSLMFSALNTPTYINVLANDSDPDGDPISIVSYTVSGAVAINFADKNGFSLVGVGVTHATGTVTYTITDGKGGQASATVTTQNP